ncbi:hypothetical protein AYO44_01350 [Planctomycetaceae bacterium SCGC AG-212-F19]|nr:hypothetical protein AYO44_01350 [Planctomycetaceae bacterium SCGC AG-212-F19]
MCDGLSRRDLLRAGALGAMGLTLPDLLRLQETHAAPGKPAVDACILLFLWGAPSQYETFDPKPNAPDGIRGEFGTIPTALPGVIFSEHIPRLAQRTDKFALVRTCAQTSTHHQSAAYEALTGFPPSRDAVALTATATDHPNVGSVVSKYATGRHDMPRFVQLPEVCYDVGNLTPGQYGGFLGRQHDPLVVHKDPNARDFNVAEVTLPPEVAAGRLDDRQALLRLVDQQARTLEHSASAQSLDAFQDRAFRLLTSPAVKKAFDLGREANQLRDRYGRNPLGQSCLLARRLVEAGVKLVTVCSAFGGKVPQDAWDTHKDNFRSLKNKLLPPMDQGVSALLDDLHQTGLSRRTLLIVMGEFGRTPRINAQAGRDHWEKCYSILLAGGPVKAGQVYGQSDRIGAYPTSGRVFSPADMTATVYHCLGIDHHADMNDQAGRPLRISTGEPMTELF